MKRQTVCTVGRSREPSVNRCLLLLKSFSEVFHVCTLRRTFLWDPTCLGSKLQQASTSTDMLQQGSLCLGDIGDLKELMWETKNGDPEDPDQIRPVNPTMNPNTATPHQTPHHRSNTAFIHLTRPCRSSSLPVFRSSGLAPRLAARVERSTSGTNARARRGHGRAPELAGPLGAAGIRIRSSEEAPEPGGSARS